MEVNPLPRTQICLSKFMDFYGSSLAAKAYKSPFLAEKPSDFLTSSLVSFVQRASGPQLRSVAALSGWLKKACGKATGRPLLIGLPAAAQGSF